MGTAAPRSAAFRNAKPVNPVTVVAAWVVSLPWTEVMPRFVTAISPTQFYNYTGKPEIFRGWRRDTMILPPLVGMMTRRADSEN